MAQNIAVPDIGDFKEVEVIEVLVKPGDQINKNDPVVTIESDKSSVEIPSPESGKIKDTFTYRVVILFSCDWYVYSLFQNLLMHVLFPL